MQKKMIITIAGKPGSGKSTASKAIATELGYQHFSSGDLFRAIAKEKKIDLLTANFAAEQESEIDHLVDKRLQDIGASEEQVVIDSRLAWHWMPMSFKVYLDLDLRVAAERILNALDPTRIDIEHIPESPAEYAGELQHRLDSEARRYKALYDANPYDTRNYDLVVDTEKNSPEQVRDLILDSYQQWLRDKG